MEVVFQGNIQHISSMRSEILDHQSKLICCINWETKKKETPQTTQKYEFCRMNSVLKVFSTSDQAPKDTFQL